MSEDRRNRRPTTTKPSKFGAMPGRWADDAPCKEPGVWLDAFHPSGPESAKQIRYATDMCNGRPRDGRPTMTPCPVRDECLVFALQTGMHDAQGIWGGMTEEARRALIKRTQNQRVNERRRAQRAAKSAAA